MQQQQAERYCESAGVTVDVAGLIRVACYVDDGVDMPYVAVEVQRYELAEDGKPEVVSYDTIGAVDYEGRTEAELAADVDAVLVKHGLWVGPGQTVRVRRFGRDYDAVVERTTNRRVLVNGECKSGRKWACWYPRFMVRLGLSDLP